MEKKIKYEDIKNDLTFDVYGKTEKITVCGHEITVARSLTYNELLYFVEYVANSCFTDDGIYVPQVFTTMFRSAVINSFTDIEVPVEMDAKFSFVNYTSVYDEVAAVVGKDLIGYLSDIVDEKIDYLIKQNTESIKADLQKTAGMLQGVAQTVQDMAKGFDADTISGLMTALDKNTADRNQLIAAYSAKAELMREEAKQSDENGDH